MMMKKYIAAVLYAISVSTSFAFTVNATPRGYLRIPAGESDQPNDIVLPPIGAVPSDDVLNGIAIRDTGFPQKGFGAFAKCAIEKGTYLGTFQGLRYDSRELLDEIMQERMDKIKDMEGDSGKYIFPMDYVISLDGGKTFIDAYERAQDRFYYEPVHLNHADAGTPGCNVIRVLDGERMCFFTSRDIKEGEELAYDYGEDFWVGREDMKV